MRGVLSLPPSLPVSPVTRARFNAIVSWIIEKKRLSGSINKWAHKIITARSMMTIAEDCQLREAEQIRLETRQRSGCSNIWTNTFLQILILRFHFHFLDFCFLTRFSFHWIFFINRVFSPLTDIRFEILDFLDRERRGGKKKNVKAIRDFKSYKK